MRRALNPSSLSYLFKAILFLSITQSCLTGRGRDDHGEALGVPGRKAWTMETPANMVFISGGSFMSGAVTKDPALIPGANRPMAVSDFYMDETEVTNNMYRQFIEDLLAKASTDTEQQIGDYEDKEDFPEDNDEEASSVEGKSVVQREGAADTEGFSEAFIREYLYPDMSVWRTDFGHHMADHLLDYYEHPGFDEFPVVGITWEAARQYATWRTKYLNDYREKKGLPKMSEFRLATAAEWEYAARGGKELAKYPWGGPYVRDLEGKVLANFKTGPGNYKECGYDCTSPVKHFAPNDYGLYDMAGNVAEWTLDAYNPAAVALVWSLNPVYIDENQPLKIIKGGSWKDVSQFLQTGAIDYEHKDKARSFIGFRCVMSHIGARSRH